MIAKHNERRVRRWQVGLAALALAAAGCNLDMPGPAKGKSAARGRVVKSTDGVSSVTAPAGWAVRTDLHEEADLQIADGRRDAYLIVLSESKLDFADEVDYRAHARLTLDQIVANAKSAKVVRGPTELVVGGKQAVQYEIHGSSENVRVAWIHTTVDGKNSYHQLLAWTIPSRLASNRQMLDEVINSFTEVE